MTTDGKNIEATTVADGFSVEFCLRCTNGYQLLEADSLKISQVPDETYVVANPLPKTEFENNWSN